MSSISVSIVTYNSAEVISFALQSLLSHGSKPEIYVVDNASSDGTVQAVSRFEGVHCLAFPDNPGFGAGHNRVLSRLSSDYHVIMNPDISFTDDVLGVLSAYLDAHPQAVLATPTILNPDGSVQDVPRVLPKRRYMFASKLERFGGVFRRWRDEYTRRKEIFTQPTPITSCTGCFMMVRTEALKAVHGFDERFFLYCEDADLSRRLAPFGELVLVPETAVTHRWERASGKNGKYLHVHLRSIHRYFQKWRRGA